MYTDSTAKLLLVEDSPQNLRMLAEVLQGEFRIAFATNGPDALAIAENSDAPELILLDIMLPGMDGYEVCRRLKANPATRDIPVIFLTAMRMEEHETMGLELGAVDYICKPFSPPIVRARVRAHLELKRSRDKLKEMAACDGLTGVANRRRFDEFLNLEWGRAIRESSTLALMFIDVDHFKELNDNYAHSVGDDCLRRIAHTLEACVRRPGDLLARYGGDEFATVLTKTNREGAALIAELMRERVAAESIEHGFSPVAAHATISIGIASLVPRRDAYVSVLLETADKALYQAKSAGRNTVRWIEL